MKMQGLIVSGILGNIDSVTDESDRFMSRILVKFVNGYELSIIRGNFSYGGESCLFEIAIFDNFGEFCTKRVFSTRYSESLNDDVIGWQSEDDVKGWAIYIATLPIMEAIK